MAASRASRPGTAAVGSPARATGREVRQRRQPDTEQPAAITVHLIKQLELAIRARLEPIARRFDITGPQYVALSMLQREPGMSSAELARRSYVTAQAANEIVGALERKGLIERRTDPINNRVRRINLTRKGSSALRSCNSEVTKLEQELLLPLGDTRPHALRKSLQSCLDALGPATA
jgi:DNA-binding MarR family transcriptional regulator